MRLDVLVIPCALGLGRTAEARLPCPGLLALGKSTQQWEGQGQPVTEQSSISGIAAGKAGEALYHLRDMLKQRSEEGGPVFAVPHWFTVYGWGKALSNRSQVQMKSDQVGIRSWEGEGKKRLARERHHGHVLSQSVTCCLRYLSVSQYLRLWKTSSLSTMNCSCGQKVRKIQWLAAGFIEKKNQQGKLLVIC